MSEAVSQIEFDRLRAILATQDLASLGPEHREGVKPSRQLSDEIRAWAKPLKLGEQTRELILGAALLWLDHLDEAHTIAQDIPSVEGSFLHGIMHRREPDYGNAKYWFHRVGKHAAFPAIAVGVDKLPASQSNRFAGELVLKGAWQPMNFIDVCEEVADRPSTDAAVKLLQEVQRIEFDALLEHICLKNV